ncbi:MAG: murein transglycosylase [Nitrosomonas sp.]|nr:MAG: murein transglycosylase [Nitrosomonas sp.]
MKKQFSLLALVLTLLLNACSPETRTLPVTTESSEKSIEPTATLPQPTPAMPHLKAADWSELADWPNDDIFPAWEAFLQSCTVLNKQPIWKKNCTTAVSLIQPDNATLIDFFEKNFVPYQILNADNSADGLITGYYEPLLQGSRKPSDQYRFPLYKAPDELLVIDLGTVYPEIKDLNLRGRLNGGNVIPFYTRAEIMNNPDLLDGYEFLWVDDKVELFFLQIQGSGRIALENGKILNIGYAEHNGHPYRSIGKLLVQQGELPLEKASMQGIKHWGQQNPEKLDNLLQQNSRFIFFRELPEGLSGPLGALGVPLTAGRSLAIDPRAIPQGAPVFLATTWPNTQKPLQRLMVAQDTGNAIKGNVRADFFWGFGSEAENQAGKMKQTGKMWVLMPNAFTPSVQ